MFCAAEEVLGRYIDLAIRQGSLRAFIAARGLRFPSYLFYADDILLFCAASVSNAKQLFTILRDYAESSGQFFNPDKSKVFFGSRVSSRTCRLVQRTLGISQGSLPFSYPGAPIFRGIPRRANFQPLADRILAKFSSWKGSSLSMAGRLCLVESVIMSSFVHSMMVSRWPGTLLKDLDAAIRKSGQGISGAESLSHGRKLVFLKPKVVFVSLLWSKKLFFFAYLGIFSRRRLHCCSFFVNATFMIWGSLVLPIFPPRFGMHVSGTSVL